jgi:hypothetical protein
MVKSEIVKRIVPGAICGGIVGTLVFWFIKYPSLWKWILASALIGIVLALMWPLGRSVVIRFRIEDWRLEQVEIQGIRFTSAGLQRRVAWRLFVEMATRIATQPMSEEEGDDGIALNSLYELFQLTRQAVAEMEPTPKATGDTVETFALDMLNSDLRPFLSKWHPKWDDFVKSKSSDGWELHTQFRGELAILQSQIETRARGLAELARVKNVERFFKPRSDEKV